MEGSISCSLESYIGLERLVGGSAQNGKLGAIDAEQSRTLPCLNIDTDTWPHIATAFEDGWEAIHARPQVCGNRGIYRACATEGDQSLHPF